jgi:phage/plasmid-like protein (TIGR03299 family)
MSKETLEWLNANTLIGFTAERGRAWHYRAAFQSGGGNHFPGAIPVDEVERRLFAWDAVESPVYVESPVSGGLAVAPGRKAIVRSDTGCVMGVFTDGYTPHPYREWLVRNVAMILDGDLGIGSAGLLRSGAVAWVSVEVPDSITTPEGVEFRPNLLATTSFDGSLATTYKRVVTNVVCDNTMAAGLAERGQRTRVRHSRHSHLKLAEARQALAVVHTIADDFAAEVAHLCATAVTDRQWREFLDAHAPVPDKPGRAHTLAEHKRDTLTRLWDHDARVSPWRGTAWGVVQAINTYTHHEGSVRGANRAERNMIRAVTDGVDQLDGGTVAALRRVLAATG